MKEGPAAPRPRRPEPPGQRTSRRRPGTLEESDGGFEPPQSNCREPAPLPNEASGRRGRASPDGGGSAPERTASMCSPSARLVPAAGRRSAQPTAGCRPSRSRAGVSLGGRKADTEPFYRERPCQVFGMTAEQLDVPRVEAVKRQRERGDPRRGGRRRRRFVPGRYGGCRPIGWLVGAALGGGSCCGPGAGRSSGGRPVIG
jgi:hypothetical protein